MERVFYRIVRNPEVSEDDFKPAKDLGKPLTNQRFARQWAEGVSVYDTFEHAVARARLYRYKLGRFVVTVRLPVGTDVEVEQSGDDPRHYTLYAPPSRLLELVSGRPRRVDER